MFYVQKSLQVLSFISTWPLRRRCQLTVNQSRKKCLLCRAAGFSVMLLLLFRFVHWQTTAQCFYHESSYCGAPHWRRARWCHSAAMTSRQELLKWSDSIYGRSINILSTTSWPEVSTLGVQGVQNVPLSAWVKIDAASKTTNVTSVETHTLVASVFYILYPLYRIFS